MIPESAPFTEEQRAWLNGFFAGLVGLPNTTPAVAGLAAAVMPQWAGDQSFDGGQSFDGHQSSGAATATMEEEAEDFPWRDASLPILDRVALAAGKPVKHKLMAAMAQLDCGSCGYLCQTYSEAISTGEETNLTLCSPGGKETKQMLKKILSESSGTEPAVRIAVANGKPQAVSHGFNRKNPFTAKVIESRRLNQEGSAKDTRHVAIDLSGSGLSYEVGDALGIFPTNCGDLAAMIIDRLASDPQVTVTTPDGSRKTLIRAICEDWCLKDPTDELLELLIGRIDNHDDRTILATMLRERVPEGVDVLDVLSIADGAAITATEFVETLSPLNPRLYSIASSMRHVGDEVHLTVGKVVYEREGRRRKGVASTMLAERAEPGDTVRVFVQPNHGGFTVPSDPTKPMIMVGPGTGIAPFVAFLQERAGTTGSGDNWLFFGDQHEASDFLYKSELQNYVRSSVLTRLDTAFSRDGEQKVYVQDRMREQGAELWTWLQRGAYFYVCGDASRMAKDVDRTLMEICSVQGQMRTDEAKRYVTQLAAERRYVRDVY